MSQTRITSLEDLEAMAAQGREIAALRAEVSRLTAQRDDALSELTEKRASLKAAQASLAAVQQNAAREAFIAGYMQGGLDGAWSVDRATMHTFAVKRWAEVDAARGAARSGGKGV